MNWLDLLILSFLVVSFIVGFLRGFVKFLFPLLGLVVGVALAKEHYSTLSPLLSFILKGWVEVGAFAIIFASIVLLSHFLALTLSRLLSWLMLGWLNRLLGAFLGLVTGGVLWALGLIFLVQLPLFREITLQSRVALFLVDHLLFLLSLFPESWQMPFKFPGL